MDAIVEAKFNIKYIIETQLHTDLNPEIDLIKEKLTDCKFIYGNLEDPRDNQYKSSNNEKFELGKIKLEVVYTPGVSFESCSVLLLVED